MKRKRSTVLVDRGERDSQVAETAWRLCRNLQLTA